MRNRLSIRIGIVVSLLVTSTLVPTALTVSNAACVQVKPTGKTVGTIKAGNVSMPIKSFTYPAGGIMEPQKSVLAAGLSKRHMPLNSTLGTSVITWHINFKGCWNKLNLLMSKKKGFVFTIIDEDGVESGMGADKLPHIRSVVTKQAVYRPAIPFRQGDERDARELLSCRHLAQHLVTDDG